MIDLLHISTEVASHAIEAGGHAVASGNPLEQISSGFHVEVKTLLAQIVSFLLIFIALRIWAWGPILKVLDERREKIADGIKYAEEMKTKLADAERQQSETMKQAAQEAQELTAQAQKTAKDIVERTQEEAQRKAQELVAQARENLEMERRQMLTEVKEHASKMIALTAAKVLSKELSDSERKKFVESATQELKS